MLEKLKKEKKYILISIIIGFFITIIFTTKSYSDNIQQSISEELIRFHILANSNSDEDQELKIIVKNEIINLLEDELKTSTSKEETRELLENNLQKIIETAQKIVYENGYDYKVDAKLTKAYFPTKVYGDVSLPAGEYEALQITIGEAKGQNWWCVMFPPLCFVDVTFKEVPIEDKILLKNILSEEEYNLVTNYTNDEKISVQVKFKIVELWQELMNKLNIDNKTK